MADRIRQSCSSTPEQIRGGRTGSLIASVLGAVGVVVVVLATGCENGGITDPVQESDSLVVVSNAIGKVSAGSPPSAALAGGPLAATTTETHHAFISLTPGTVREGSRATVRNSRTGQAVSVSMTDGGFDPVPLDAQMGDVITIDVRVASSVFRIVHPVPPRRPPVIVRTYPPPKKRDVPLNARVLIVFSEPVDAATLGGAVRLTSGGVEVPGIVELMDAGGSMAVFSPDGLLDPATTYVLEVTNAVRDREGDVLEAARVEEFTTGTNLSGSVASITLSPDSIGGLVPNTTYDIIPTVRDAEGNVLSEVALTWTSSSPNVATASPVDSVWLSGGRVTGISEGTAIITATHGSVSATAHVTVSEPPPAGVASVTVTPETISLAQYDGDTLNVVLRDSTGRELGSPSGPLDHDTYLTVSWVVDRPDIVSIAKDTMSLPPHTWTAQWNTQSITGLAEGSAMVIATSEGVSDTAYVTVGPPRSVASIRVDPAHWTVPAGSTHTLRVQLFDANGEHITPWKGGMREIAFTVDRPAVAAVNSSAPDCGVDTWPFSYGAYVPRCRFEVTILDTGFVTITANSEGISDSVSIAAPLLVFTSVSAGGHVDVWYVDDFIGHTCGVTVGGLTVCWGGDGGTQGDEWRHFSSRPWGLSGGHRFTVVSAGTLHSCGLTDTRVAQCWSSEIFLDPWYDYAMTGETLFGLTVEPQPLPGTHTFVMLDGGASRMCGLSTAGAAYCWNGSAQMPAMVPGGLTFATVTAGRDHACGLTSDGTAYCWGSNASGQLGDGSTVDAASPVAVSGGHTFVAITAGSAHTCGLLSDGKAYCWGDNGRGELGDGSTTDRPVPTAVAGNLTFSGLSSGDAASTTCAIVPGGTTYCWGDNRWGQVGDGTTIDRLVPTAVAGQLNLASVSTADRHSCGVTPGGVAYCWGSNRAGQLGDGTRTSSNVPVRVAGQP